jgi:hypothetical protein
MYLLEIMAIPLLLLDSAVRKSDEEKDHESISQVQQLCQKKTSTARTVLHT